MVIFKTRKLLSPLPRSFPKFLKLPMVEMLYITVLVLSKDSSRVRLWSMSTSNNAIQHTFPAITIDIQNYGFLFTKLSIRFKRLLKKLLIIIVKIVVKLNINYLRYYHNYNCSLMAHKETALKLSIFCLASNTMFGLIFVYYMDFKLTDKNVASVNFVKKKCGDLFLLNISYLLNAGLNCTTSPYCNF